MLSRGAEAELSLWLLWLFRLLIKGRKTFLALGIPGWNGAVKNLLWARKQSRKKVPGVAAGKCLTLASETSLSPKLQQANLCATHALLCLICA